MLHKLIFLALLFCLTAAPIAAVRPIHLHRSLKISKLSGDALIQAACHGIGVNETECVTTLQSASPDQKANANGLAFFALRFVEDRAENITAGIKKLAAVPDVAPLLQSALTDCMEQYTSVDDLIENAIAALESKNYADAQQFVTAAMSNIDLCDSEFNNSGSEEAAEKKEGKSVDMEKDLKNYNLFHKNLLCAALNFLTVD